MLSLIVSAQSVPMDVPSPRQSWMRSIDLIDEDSGLASCEYTSQRFRTRNYNASLKLRKTLVLIFQDAKNNVLN